MSETVLCQEYSDYCKSAGIFTGGGFSDKSSQYISVATGTIDSLVDGVSSLNEKIASAVKSAAGNGGKISASAIREVSKALNSVNEAALSTVKNGQSVASRVAHVFIGAANNNMPYSIKFTGGSEGLDPIFGHSELMLSTLEFLGGASSDVTETVKARIAAFDRSSGRRGRSEVSHRSFRSGRTVRGARRRRVLDSGPKRDRRSTRRRTTRVSLVGAARRS